MKQVHNVRVRIHNADQALVDEILDKVEAMARRDERDVIERSTMTEDGLVIGELWLDHQAPIRRLLAAMLARMDAADKERIRTNPTRYLDTGTHCFFHLQTKALHEGRAVLAEKPAGTVNVRLNIACWPANRENAAATMQDLFI